MTKRYAILFLIIFAAAATVAWATSDQAKDEAQLKQLVQTWDAAFVKGDAATLDRLAA